MALVSAAYQTPTTADLFPPVCLKYHWDPTALTRRVLPQGSSVGLGLDPRPWTKVCMEYQGGTSGSVGEMPSDFVMPPGGPSSGLTPTRFNIDADTILRGLDRKVGICKRDDYKPSLDSTMYVAGKTVPDRDQPSSHMIDELSFPKALLRIGPYDCRAEADKINLSRSQNLFNNSTKQQRYVSRTK